MAFATAGMVAGAYHRCGLGVLSGKCSSACTSMILRFEFGVAASILFIHASYPTPFCTTSCAALTVWETEGLDSKVCGSVVGLLKIATTRTYFPPIWPMTFAYSFSAPTATMPPLGAVGAPEADEHPASRPALTSTAIAAAVRTAMVGSVSMSEGSGGKHSAAP